MALTEQGYRRRYPDGADPKVRDALDKELEITAELHYAQYFLTVHDIVHFARSKGILCQGRGSAANSVICYCLEITEVDPEKVDLLFERFVSEERKEPPDIDVDFEHERREEVIQHIYEKYGRASRQPHRDRDLLSRPQRDPRGRQGVRAVRRHRRRARRHAVGLVAVRREGEGGAQGRSRSVRSAAQPGDAAGRGADRYAASPLAACRRLPDHALAHRRGRAGRERRDGRAHRHRMGKGRSRNAAAAEGRCARPRHAVVPAARPRSAANPLPAHAHHPVTSGAGAQKRTEGSATAGLSHDPARRHARHLPDRKPRADVDAAAAAAEGVLRSRHRGRDRAAGADPGQDGASLSAAAREVPRDAGGAGLSVARRRSMADRTNCAAS